MQETNRVEQMTKKTISAHIDDPVYWIEYFKDNELCYLYISESALCGLENDDWFLSGWQVIETYDDGERFLYTDTDGGLRNLKPLQDL